MKCKKCNGTGIVGLGEGIRGIKKCDACDGTGELTSRYTDNGACGNCGTLIPADDRLDFIPREEVKYCYSCGAKIRA